MTTSRRLLVMPLALALSILLLGACSEDRPRRRGRAEGVVVIDFDDYRGSEVSLPDNVFVSGEDGSDVPVTGDFYPFTGVSSLEREDDFDGFGAFTADGDDYSFGIREHGAADLRDSRLFVRYENRTNRTVYGFKLSYDVETWLNGDRDNRIRLKYNTRRDGFGSIDDIVSTANPLTAAPGDDRPGRPVDGSLHENRTTVEVAFHFSELRGMAEGGLDRFGTLEPGETGYLRWQYSNHHLTEGSVRSALALNNIIVEPILTPPRDADRGASEPLGAIALSRSAGFYDEPFDLELSTSLPEARIYYTVDGSRPDPDAVMSDTQWADLPIETRRRTFEYRRPIDLAALEQRENDVATIPTSVRDSDPVWIPPETRLPKAATVRAVAIGAQSRSAVRTATFLFAPSGETHHELPVWSIQTDRGSFFDPDSGIYVPGPDAPEVNYFRRGSDWEAEAHIEFFEDDRRRVLAQQMGIRIHGNYTRTYPQKSLRLYSRTDYGPGRMSHRFLRTKEIDDFNRLLLRNGGNDFSGGMLSDPVAQTLVQHLSFDTQHYRPSVVYLNGEYWGIHNMRDRYDQHYLETHYGIPRDEVLILEGEGVVDTGAQQTVGEIYDPFVDFRERVASGEIADWEALDEEMALSEYIDYVFVQVYAGNYDWPQNNIRYWRYAGPNPTAERGPRDGRWRWMLYDVDFAFGHQFSTTFDMVEWSFGFTEEHPFLEEWRREQYQDRFEINQRIAEVTEIRQELLQRFAVHLATTASERRALEFVNRHAARIESEMRRQIARWSYPKSMDAWYAVVETMRDFARRRPQIVRDHLLRFFDDVTGFAELSVAGITDSSGLSLHTIDLDDRTEGVEIEDGRWSGMLFTGIPVTIESSRSDLRDATFEPDERVQIIERSQQRLSFYLNGNAGITLSTESQ